MRCTHLDADGDVCQPILSVVEPQDPTVGTRDEVDPKPEEEE